MRKEYFIRDLSKLGPNDKFESVFLVQSKEIRQKKSGDHFLSLRLADRTGSLDAKMWDNVPTFADKFEAHDLVNVRGKVQVYNNSQQIIVHRIESIPERHASLADFVPHTERDIETMYAEVLAIIDGFKNQHLKRLMGSIFKNPKFAAAYKRAPAASSMHHARIGGLLEHVSSVVRLAIMVSSHYDDIDHDLLVSGVLLHDLGKIRELTAGPSFEYTDEGRLLGHLAIGSAWVGRRCDEINGFPPRLKALLLHMILSHHGKLEFGSPQVPQFPEALALHFIDDLDSKLEAMRTASASISEGNVWSRFHKGLDRFVLDKEAYLRADPAWAPPQAPVATQGEGAVEKAVETRPAAISPPPDLPVSDAIEPATAPAARPETVTPEPEVQGEVQGTSATESATAPDEPETVPPQPPPSSPPPDLPVTGEVEAESAAEPEPEEPAPDPAAEEEVQASPTPDSDLKPDESEPIEESGAVSGSEDEPPANTSSSDEPAKSEEPQTVAPEADEPQLETEPTAKPAAEPLRPVPIESPNFVVNRPERAQSIHPPELPVSDQSSLFAASEPGPEKASE